MTLVNTLFISLRRVLCIVLVALCVWPASPAAEIELDGLLIDRTVSRFGQDFIYYYAGYWRELPGTSGFTVTIYETVYPQSGTKLWIEVNQKRIYETYFGRRYNDTKARADEAMRITIEHVAQVKADLMLGRGDERW